MMDLQLLLDFHSLLDVNNTTVVYIHEEGRGKKKNCSISLYHDIVASYGCRSLQCLS